MINLRRVTGIEILFTNGYGVLVPSGQLVLQDDIVCAPINDVAIAGIGIAKSEGVFNTPCSGPVATVGLNLFLNDTTHKVTTNSGPLGACGFGTHVHAGTSFRIAGYETASYCWTKLLGHADFRARAV